VEARTLISRSVGQAKCILAISFMERCRHIAIDMTMSTMAT
jgi:hypothetical protein